MGIITSRLKNCTESTTSINATLTNNNVNYAVAGIPGNTSVLFEKTITAAANHVFTKEPTLNFEETNFPKNYSAITVDTGSIATNNFTARKFTVSYLFPETASSGDVMVFNSEASSVPASSSGKLYAFGLNILNIPSTGDTRTLTINGDAGSTLQVLVKISSGANVPIATATVSVASDATTQTLVEKNPNIYPGMTVTGAGISGTVIVNSISTDGLVLTLNSSQTLAKGALLAFGGVFTARIPNTGIFSLDIFFQPITSNTIFNVVLTEITSGSFVRAMSSQSGVAVVLTQLKPITTTFNITNTSPPSSGSFVLSANSFTHTGPAQTNNINTKSYRDTVISFTATSSATNYNIVKNPSNEFNAAVFVSPTAVVGNVLVLTGGTRVRLSNFEISISNPSGQAKTATISCVAAVEFNGSSNQITGFNINDIIITQQ